MTDIKKTTREASQLFARKGGRVTPILFLGDSIAVLKSLNPDSVDAVVTDPPYGLAFMGKKWDYDVPSVELWREVLRVLKPGGHVLSFGGTRTYHRMVVNIEDAGFEIRDQLQWIYGSGFPKSHNLNGEWQGWGTALKPANEPIVLARKPLIGTVAKNVEAWGTSALNIDGCRIDLKPGETTHGSGRSQSNNPNTGYGDMGEKRVGAPNIHTTQGRWPANVIFDEEAAAVLDKQSEAVSRFFYVAKASRRERGEGNVHPTVKPIKLMEYLVKLVTPPNGTVLDPFMGSGTTGIAAKNLGFGFVGCELDAEYFKIASRRIAAQPISEIAELAAIEKGEA